jgi:hypothetical protein
MRRIINRSPVPVGFFNPIDGPERKDRLFVDTDVSTQDSEAVRSPTFHPNNRAFDILFYVVPQLLDNFFSTTLYRPCYQPHYVRSSLKTKILLVLKVCIMLSFFNLEVYHNQLLLTLYLLWALRYR